jgi:hypothetical protein
MGIVSDVQQCRWATAPVTNTGDLLLAEVGVPEMAARTATTARMMGR